MWSKNSCGFRPGRVTGAYVHTFVHYAKVMKNKLRTKKYTIFYTIFIRPVRLFYYKVTQAEKTAQTRRIVKGH